MTTALATRPATKPTARDRVLDVFRDLPDGTTAKQIMDATGLSRTTVNDSLRKLAEAGDVVRFDQGGVSEWSLTPARKAANKRAAAKLAAKATNAGDAKPAKRQVVHLPNGRDAVVVERTPTGKRAKGVIDAEIVAFLRSRPGETFGSYEVAKNIGSSAGAAYVALNRMDREGKVVKASVEPDRYKLA